MNPVRARWFINIRRNKVVYQTNKHYLNGGLTG